LIGFVNAEVRINEVELNPEGIDSGNEWIELYSSNEINLTGFELKDAANNTHKLNVTFNGYYLIKDLDFILNNDDEKLFIYNGSDIIFETRIFDDSNNDNRTWQYCNGQWNFTLQTLEQENNCAIENENPNEPSDPQDREENEDEIYIEIEWDEDEIINGDEFEITFKVYNLDDDEYNVKIWIEDDDENIISDRYDEEEDEWKSGSYYIYDFFKGPGDESEDVTLRIRDDYDDFFDDATIFAKLKGVIEIDENIEILEEEKNKKDKENNLVTFISKSGENKNTNNNLEYDSEEIISLGVNKENIDSNLSDNNNTNTQGKIIYTSSSEKLKKYSIYGFALFCLILCGLLINDKLK
jgi:hypothetical protein